MENLINSYCIDNISDAQRRCLSHILRNCEQAINGVLTLVENKSAVFSPHDIAISLQSACKQLDSVLEAAMEGSFCTMTVADCKFVSTFVGCSGQPYSISGKRATDKKMQ